MKAREYAISLGLAKASRGKLSKEAHSAIQKAIADGMEFTDYGDKKKGSGENINVKLPVTNSNNVNETSEPIKIKSRPATHKYSTIYGVDTRGRSGIVIAFQYCSKCISQVKYCSHAIPQLPEWIGGGDGLTVQPTQEQANIIMLNRRKADSAWEKETI
jgi:hypothetical protein